MPRESAFFLASESVCLSFDIFGSTFRRKAKIEMILSRALHTSDSLAVSPQEGDAGQTGKVRGRFSTAANVAPKKGAITSLGETTREVDFLRLSGASSNLRSDSPWLLCVLSPKDYAA